MKLTKVNQQGTHYPNQPLFFMEPKKRLYQDIYCNEQIQRMRKI